MIAIAPVMPTREQARRIRSRRDPRSRGCLGNAFRGGGFGNAPRATVAAAADPVTLTPSGYWEQRGDTSDYSIASGVWAKRSATGSNWVQGIQTSLPAVGSLVDGKAPWYPHVDSSHALDNAGTMATYGTTTQFALSLLVYVPSGLIYGSNGNTAAGILGDIKAQQYWTMGVGDFAGVTYVGLEIYDGGVRDAKVAVTPNAWNQINVRHDAGVLSIGCNAPPPASGAQTVACGPLQNVYSLTTNPNASAATGAMFLSLFFKQTMADADYGTIRTWWRGPQYPSLAGVLPA